MLASSRHFAVEEADMFDPASVRVRGPLQAHVKGFWADLLRHGYAPLSARGLLQLAAHLGRWLDSERLALADVSDEVIAAFLRHRRRRHTHLLTRRAMEPLLGYLRGVGVIPTPLPIVDDSPIGEFVREYAAYLRWERGLAASTIRARTEFARQFVLDERPRLEWAQL